MHQLFQIQADQPHHLRGHIPVLFRRGVQQHPVQIAQKLLLLLLGNDPSRMTAAISVEGDASLLTLLVENLNQAPILETSGFDIIEP